MHEHNTPTSPITTSTFLGLLSLAMLVVTCLLLYPSFMTRLAEYAIEDAQQHGAPTTALFDWVSPTVMYYICSAQVIVLVIGGLYKANRSFFRQTGAGPGSAEGGKAD